nr:ChaN family lipoprotein [uncultured Rhodoferax sp.]
MAELKILQNAAAAMARCAVWPALLFAAALSGCAVPPNVPSANILLLGEVHDNPLGHQRRLADLQERILVGWRPAIVMEQFDRENQAALTQAQASCADAQCVIQAAGGKRWEWPLYEPVIALALRHKLPLLAGNVSRSEAAMVMQQGFAVLGADTVAAFRLDAPLPVDLFEGQRRAIEIGHCGKLPEGLAQGMVRAQVARDVWMAKMLQDNAQTGAVLLAGNGHVRKDLGVPRWLVLTTTPIRFQVHGFVEQGAADSTAAYDVTHTVAVHPRPDPCLAFTTPPTANQTSRPNTKE